MQEIKGNNNPQPLVKITLETVAILLGEKTDWENIKKVLADANFSSRLKNINVS